MGTHPIGDGFDQRWPAAVTGPLGGLRGHRVAGQHVVAVDADSGHAVADRPVRDRRRRHLMADRHRDGPLVVLDEEHARRVEHRSEVQRLVRVTLTGGAVAEERQCHGILAQPLRAHRRADRVQSVGSDGNGDRCAAPLGEPDAAVPLAPPDGAHLRRRDAAQQECADLAVLGEQPIRLAQARRRADLRGLLAAAGREQRQLALALQVDEFAVEVARDDHQLVEPAQRFGW